MNHLVNQSRQLLELKKGSEQALKSYREKYGPEILMQIYLLSKDKKIARDVLTMVLITLWERRHRLDDDAHLARWLRMVARRKYLSLSGSNGPKKRSENLFAQSCRSSESTNGQEEEEKKRNDRVWAAMSRLSPRRSQVFQMRILGGMPHSVIAIILNIREQTSRNTFVKARIALRLDLRRI